MKQIKDMTQQEAAEFYIHWLMGGTLRYSYFDDPERSLEMVSFESLRDGRNSYLDNDSYFITRIYKVAKGMRFKTRGLLDVWIAKGE